MRFYKLAFLLISLLYSTSSFAGDIKAIKTNSSFEEIAHIDQLEKISVNQMPVTTYTPKNLKSQQELRFQGRNTSNGAMTVWSTTITDYDTKIVEGKVENDEYFIVDNTGKQIKTGEHIDVTPLQTEIQNNKTNIENTNVKVDQNIQNITTLNTNVSTHTTQINTINTSLDTINTQVSKNTQDIINLDQKINHYELDMNHVYNRMNKLEHRLDSGLATVTAISALKSNPRSCAKSELSMGVGVYRDKTAIATGIIYHYNNDVMLTGGIGYSDPNTVGFGSVTFSLF